VIVVFVDVNVPEFAIEFVDNPPFRDDKALTPIVPVIVVFVDVNVPELDIDFTSKTPKLFKVAFVVAPFFTIIP
jgi:hypothetical protein